jgi:hypothetical protein
MASPNQLWNEGSVILYRRNLPSAPVIATWQISPRHPSINVQTKRPDASGAIWARRGKDSEDGSGSAASPQEPHRPLDFQPPNVGTGIHVTVVGRDGGNIRELIDSKRMVAADIPLHAAGPRRWADQPQIQTMLKRDGADVLEARQHGCGLPQQLDRFGNVPPRGFQPTLELVN